MYMNVDCFDNLKLELPYSKNKFSLLRLSIMTVSINNTDELKIGWSIEKRGTFLLKFLKDV